VAQLNHWHSLFHLAYHGKGMVINLNEVPDYAIDWFVDWHNAAAKEYGQKIPDM